MSTVLAKWMTLFLSLTIMFTPMFVYLDSLHREALDLVLHQGLKEASIQGYFTPTILNEMKDTLKNDYKFDETLITINTTDSTPQVRGQYIEIEISVPRGPIFIFNIFNQGPSTITRKAQIMSEYIL
ncbi:hypothetical protein ACFYKX_25475 [Cytobacillus sp. FJAT-54145]|uniref:DUF3888 domain-containing protein n=1 Tax=Cytobacillus spartinae TaxID=3299023 RepID=A0ABW6KK29_9BACI